MAIEVSNITQTSADISTSFIVLASIPGRASNYILVFEGSIIDSQRLEGRVASERVSLSGTVISLSPGATYIISVINQRFLGDLVVSSETVERASFTTLPAATPHCNCHWHSAIELGHTGSGCDGIGHGARPPEPPPPVPTLTLQDNAPDPPIAGETYGATAIV